MPGTNGEADHKKLGENESGESDGNDVIEVLLEEKQRAEHDGGALIDADEHPQEERLVGERAAFRELFVQLRVRECDLRRHVLVKDQ